MDISIIICTYNRSHNLADCFSHLVAQTNVETVDWEIILVDNNSADDTEATVKQLNQTLSLNIRYVFEGEQGLSVARNRGIQESDATWLIFIDDDIRVEPQWLHAIHEGFSLHDCDAVGGRIHIQSPESLPDWIQPDMYGFLGHRDFGDESFKMDGVNQFPFGGNMAMHRRVFERIGRFDTRMGRKGEGRKAAELFKGEETDFFMRLKETGGDTYYAQAAIVQHLILPHQLQRRFFRTLHHTAGLQKAVLDTQTFNRTLFGIPLFLYTQIIRAGAKYLVQLLSRGPAFAFRQQMNVGYFTGMARGYHQRTLSERQQGSTKA
ncbi:MAG TPA: glycosyltransferase family 2 protein [Chromatiaceae bacterium]|jgi:glycosyltransferase involved in cell wall biosynthesis|nr:glycosyltransferase family 2 protein [Chromatiaceae bacterium]HIB83586.1 glycosyltransferase family 2 protein [Chromatiaceae bacterium]HIN81612.1 glycosyltransferase family 2 protein [Chromatiales bacterium]HIO02578.1 glycosyltransferase family 2 protein [Alphaproteobacteria bacterium]HIO54542.1 glycosyltransferase family 2 protein [Chromatiales bacterium]